MPAAVNLRSVLVVAAGGAAGAVLRWAVTELVDRPDGALPVATLAVNVTGAALLGAFARWWLLHPPKWWVPLALGTGVMGAMTTMSTFAHEVATLWRTGDETLASAYLLITVTLGLAAATGGRRVVDTLTADR